MAWVALQMLYGDRAKYFGLVFGVMFATLLMAQQTSIFVGLMARTANQITDVREANVWVMDPRVRYVDEPEPMPATDLDRVRSVDGIAWAVPMYKGLTNVRAPGGVLNQVFLLGIDDASLVGAPKTMLLGSVEDLRLPDAIIIDRAGFEFIWPGEALELGRRVEMNDRTAVIVGISEPAPPFTTFPIVHTRYTNALRFTPGGRNRMSYVVARAEDGQAPEAVARHIEATTGLQARTTTEFQWQTIQYYLQRTGIPVNFGITVTLGFIVGAAIVGQTFYIFVVENMKQFGALKAIGVTNTTLAGMVLLQGSVVALVGYGLGVGLSAGFFVATAKVTALRGFYMPWQIMIGTAGAVLAIMVVSIFASLRRVMVLDPAIVFRG
ncbi:MAG: ABC transporter permease [Alphaproteobacteria bacterium]|nr:ABC transporter permease [Alphaproteobacteria bacterium]